MPLPRPRFTVRRLMVAVALIALFLGELVFLKGRRDERLRLANFHERQLILFWSGDVEHQQHRDLDEKQNDFHFRMEWKYRRAASRPWLSIPPDPPVPK